MILKLEVKTRTKGATLSVDKKIATSCSSVFKMRIRSFLYCFRFRFVLDLVECFTVTGMAQALRNRYPQLISLVCYTSFRVSPLHKI